MKRELKMQILSLCDSNELKKALLQNDYLMALGILEELYNYYDCFDGELSLFNLLYEDLCCDNLTSLVNTIDLCFHLTLISAMIRVVEFYVNKEDERTREFAEACTDIYFANLTFLNQFKEFDVEDFERFALEMLARKNKHYKTVRALRKVFSLEVCTPGRDTRTIISDYIYGLILGQDFDYKFLVKAFLEDNVDLLMEKMDIIAFLRKDYLELKQEEIDMMTLATQNAIDEIEAVGLLRRNPENKVE